MKLIVLVGPCGSGKTTFAKQLEVKGFVYINQDSQGKDEHYNKFCMALIEGKDIVVDRMNFNKDQRSRYLDEAKKYGLGGYETEIIVFHESYETCMFRILARTGHETIKTPEDAKKALDFFFSNYERVEDFEADVVERRWPECHKPQALICDLEGCAFSIVLCSGRGGEYRETTKNWLSEYGICYDHLFMRQAKDHRQDYIIKEILLDFEILTRYEPYFFIDDRQQVVDMYRKRGYTVLQCANGDF
jgi:adenylate kinase family enzyme